jgi:hypothetical protein
MNETAGYGLMQRQGLGCHYGMSCHNFSKYGSGDSESSDAAGEDDGNIKSPVIVLFCDYLPRHSKSMYWSSDNNNLARLYIFALSCLLNNVVLSISTLYLHVGPHVIHFSCANILQECDNTAIYHLHMPLNSTYLTVYLLITPVNVLKLNILYSVFITGYQKNTELLQAG